MFCPHCGTEIPEGNAFCTSCGAKLPENATAQVKTYGQLMGEDQGQPSTVPDAERNQAIKPNRTLIAALVCCAIVAAGIALFLVWQAKQPVPIDEKVFPDTTVRSDVSANFDSDSDGKLSESELDQATMLDVSNSAEVTSLAGIDRLPNLTTVVATNNTNLTDASDLSNHAKLESIDLTGSPVKTVDVSGDKSLTSIKVDDSTQVTGLDTTNLEEHWVQSSIAWSWLTSLSRNNTFEMQWNANGTPAKLTIDQMGYLGPSFQDLAYSYDDQGRVTADSQGSYTYDANGHIATMTSANSNGTSATNTYRYDERGRLASISVPDGGMLLDRSYAQGNLTETLAYDGDGRLISVRSSDTTRNQGVEYLFTFDDQGRCATSTSPAGNGGMLSRRYYTYDERGRCSKVRLVPLEYNTLEEKSDGSAGNEAEFTYDDQDRLVSVSKSTMNGQFEYGDHGFSRITVKSSNDIYETFEFSYRRLFASKGTTVSTGPVYTGYDIGLNGLSLYTKLAIPVQDDPSLVAGFNPLLPQD